MEVMSTWGLDWSEFKKGTDAVRNEARRGGREVDATFGTKSQHELGKLAKAGLGVGSAIGIAVSAIQLAKAATVEYNKTNAETASAWFGGGPFRGIMGRIGRDYAYALKDLAGDAEATLEALTDVQRAVTTPLFGSFDHSRQIEALRIVDEHSVRTSMAMREAAKYQGELRSGWEAMRGPDGGFSSQRIGERYRNRDALAAIAAASDQTDEWKQAMRDVEASRHALNERKIDEAEGARAGREVLAEALSGLDIERFHVEELKRSYRGLDAALEENRINREAARAKISIDPTLTSAERDAAFARNNALYDAKNLNDVQAYEQLAKLARERLDDMLKLDEIQRKMLDEHEAEAALDQIRLQYAQQIRAVNQDQALTDDEKADAAQKLAVLRDSSLRAASEKLTESAYHEYWSAMASQGYRSAASGLGSSLARGVFGAKGQEESSYLAIYGRTLVEKKFDQLQRTMEATGLTLKEIETNTRTRTYAVVKP
jgi:hypothetical protein